VYSAEDKFEHIHRVISDPLLRSGSAIIYFTLIRTLVEFSDRLREDGIEHVIYHGELDRSTRRSLQESFMDSRAPLVLATNAFGMGIDKPDIRVVMHADLPGSLESYYQEIGRAGRDGKPSRCELLYDQRDLATQMEFMRWSNPDADFYHRVYDMLTAEGEQIRAFGLDYLRERLHARDKHDHRLETTLAMLDRHNVISEAGDLTKLEVLSDLPAQLTDADVLAAKLRAGQEKLLALVEYVRHEGDRKAFLHAYFGLPYGAAAPQP
jgi:ATP-dependent DNA helicase RecQ